MQAIIFVVLLGIVDALIKGTIMARKEWNEIDNFWKQSSNLYPNILFICTGIVGLMYAFARWDEWYNILVFMLQVLIMGSLGLESLVYWWSLKPLGIKQKSFWKEGTPAATWFDYPDVAPWLNGLFPLNWVKRLLKEGQITREVVFCGCFAGVFLSVTIELLKNLLIGLLN